MKRQWCDDINAEFLIKEVAGLTWQIETIKLNDIDWKASAYNCARLSEALNEERIDEYAMCMRRGDVFPRIVVERGEEGYVILGGNQRCAALKRIEDDPRHVEAYVVNPLVSATRELLLRSLNSRHGWGDTKQDRIEHAVYLVMEKGVSAELASIAMAVSDKSVNDKIRAENARAELARKGIASNSFNQQSLLALNRVNDENTQLKLAQIVQEYKPIGDKVTNAVKAVLSCKSRAATQKEIARIENEFAQSRVLRATAGRSTCKRKDDFFRHANNLSEFLEIGNSGRAFSTMDELGINKDREGDKVNLVAAKIIHRLQCIMEASK